MHDVQEFTSDRRQLLQLISGHPIHLFNVLSNTNPIAHYVQVEP